MSVNFRIELSGVPELEGELNRLSSVRWEAVRKKQVTQMLNRARSSGTPVDTGELRNSSSSSGEEMGYSADYAPHVEYGHRTRSGGYVQGQHYLKKNVETQRKIYKDDLINAIKKEG